MLRPALLLLVLLATAAHPGYGCKCPGSSSVCHSYSGADVVFIGTVESVEPELDLWHGKVRAEFEKLFPGRPPEYIELDESPETTAKLRQFYATLFGGESGRTIAAARNAHELEQALDRAMETGKRVRLRVRSLYKGLPPGTNTTDVWTDFPDCGVQFRTGETYLIYADRDNKGRLATGACSRTSRLSAAGEDLVYLQTAMNTDGRTGWVYGFVSKDKRDLDGQHFFDLVGSPVEGKLVTLTSPQFVLLAPTNKEGRFVFGGLAAGEYDLAVVPWSDGPRPEVLAGPRRVKVKQRECEVVYFYVDPSAEMK